MALLEDITPGVSIKGLLPGGSVTIVSVKRHGATSVELVYSDAGGRLGSELLYGDDVASLEIVPAGLPWRFDADGTLFRLASEAYRIRLAYLFDPLLAVHTSRIEPLPHQITAVYETMLAKQPLRYLLADDPGAGKTIMTGLLIKELVLRGDLRRCLVVAPGNLVEQWQDELSQRFSLVFDILTNDRLEASASGKRRASGTWWWWTRRTRCRPPSSAARRSTPNATASARAARQDHAPPRAADRHALDANGKKTVCRKPASRWSREHMTHSQSRFMLITVAQLQG
ncbi:MAG TPA: DEAD/DEAH box helicase family protein [Ktedonobacteraceae bacterium]|nr:DEAD/DEAH box helicase family protein [Ktedonobacteraceae bacterium]